MGTSDRYDGGLQMFVDEVHEPDLDCLAFLRWLGERGRLEHPVYGPSSGQFAPLWKVAGVAAATLPD